MHTLHNLALHAKIVSGITCKKAMFAWQQRPPWQSPIWCLWQPKLAPLCCITVCPVVVASLFSKRHLICLRLPSCTHNRALRMRQRRASCHVLA